MTRTPLVALLLMLVVPQQAAQPQVSVTAKPACKRVFTQAEHTRYARAVYGRERVSEEAQKRVLEMRRCQATGKARVNARRLTRRLRKRYEERGALTPYDCGRHGRFAVPCSVVACESHFNWNARNPSGAWGAYQLLGWLPVGASRIAQHRMAAKLWDGGRGRGHWVCAA